MANITYEQFKNEWLGVGCNPALPTKDPYNNQCVCVFRAYNHEVVGGPNVSGNAIDFFTTYPVDFYDKIINDPTNLAQIPIQGDVVIWKIGEYGHIGICDNAAQNQNTELEQNWTQAGTPNDGKGVVELRSHTYANIVGWLRPKIKNSVPTMTDDQTRALNALTAYKNNDPTLKSGNLEGAANALIGWAKDYQTLMVQNQTLTANVDDLTGKLSNLQADDDTIKNCLFNLLKTIDNLDDTARTKLILVSDWQTEADTANGNIANLNKNVAYYTPYKALYENKCKEAVGNTTTGDLFREILARIFPTKK